MTEMGESDSSLAAKCLDICQVLAGQGLAFNFSLSIGSTFSFSLDARGKGQALATQGKTKKKKKTPSTLRRNARRRSEFLKKKLDNSGEPEGPTCGGAQGPSKDNKEGVFKCDQCMNTFKSENGLKIHVGKTHRKVTLTPERPRRQSGGSLGLSASPLLEVTREEPALRDPGEPDHPHPDWVSCPRSECWVRRGMLKSEIIGKRPCKLCGEKHKKDCACVPCSSCDDDEICCNKCLCCDCNKDGEVTETEWSTYINDHLNVSPGRKKKTSTFFC